MVSYSIVLKGYKLTLALSHSAHLLLKTDDIQSDGPKPRVYVVKSDSGNEMERAWCDGCGTGIWIRQLKSPEKTNLKAGMLHAPPTAGPGRYIADST